MIKKEILIIVLLLTAMPVVAILASMPVVMAAGGGTDIGGGIGVDPVGPIVWQCGDRVLLDDDVQPWRITEENDTMIERNQQYLFEGERYEVDVMIFDKAKIGAVDVNLELEGENSSSINCYETADVNFSKCNARIGEEEITAFDPLTMQGYRCFIDILDSEKMYGPLDMEITAENPETGEDGVYDETARWFVNPIISLDVSGDLNFGDAGPGTSSYSTVYLENNAEGGVILDMFIAGKDWPSATSDPLARCWDGAGYVNYLPLSAFSYYAENGAFSTRDDETDDNGYSSVVRAVDSEGYVNINQLINAGFEEAMFNDAEIIQANEVGLGGGSSMYVSNLLYAGSTMSVTFRVDLPEPCYGEFESPTDGGFFVWGEAV